MTLHQLKIEVLRRSFRVKRVRAEKVIVGCIALNNRGRYSVKCNCGHKTEAELEKYYIEPLKSALKRLGRLGHKPNKDRNYLGNCAEQRACNQVLIIDQRHHLALNQVEYTRAYRIRTAQVKKYCPNCITALGIHN